MRTTVGKPHSRKLLCHSIALALATPLLSALPLAAAHAAAIEEVIVSARKTDENVQEVPTAITALTGNDLRNLQINNFSQVGQSVPNLNIQTQFGSASAPFFVMRGVTTGSLKFQIDSGIALYVDGVYLGRPAGTAFDLADISSIEVLRGPQGSVFGRNSTGGAINMITAEPTGEFGGHAEVGFGNYGQQRDKITINLPEYMGFSTRVTYLHNNLDGYVRNKADATVTLPEPFGRHRSADRLGMDKTDAVGFALQYTGVDKLKLNYRFDYTDKTASQMPAQLIGVTPTGYATIGFAPGIVGVPPEGTVLTSRKDSYALDMSGESKLRIQGHSLTAEYEITDNFSIKNILAYRSMDENVGINDVDGAAYTRGGDPFSLLASAEKRNQDQWSNELQFIGSTDTVDWIGGLFWFKEEGDDDNAVYVMSSYPASGGFSSAFGVPAYFAGSNGSVENKSKAVFAHATWHTTDEIDLSAGIRYTKDDRHEHVIAAGSIANESFSKSFNNTDWDVSATYKFSPDLNVYGKISTGYLTGGVVNGNAFDPEKIKSYELGAKTQFFDNSLRVNVAVFHTDREHLQLLQFNDGSNTALPAGTYLADGGKSKQDGIELEVTAAPVDGLTLTANYGHVNDHIDNGIRSYTPKNNAYLAAQYEAVQFGNGMHLDLRLDGNWVDDHHQLPCPVGSSAGVDGCSVPAAPASAALNNAAESKASWLVGARISLVDIPLTDKSKGRVSLWGKNLLDSDELEFARDVGNSVVGSYQIPRTYGVDFSVDF